MFFLPHNDTSEQITLLSSYCNLMYCMWMITARSPPPGVRSPSQFRTCPQFPRSRIAGSISSFMYLFFIYHWQSDARSVNLSRDRHLKNVIRADGKIAILFRMLLRPLKRCLNFADANTLRAGSKLLFPISSILVDFASRQFRDYMNFDTIERKIFTL